jgi:hypothetical protein
MQAPPEMTESTASKRSITGTPFPMAHPPHVCKWSRTGTGRSTAQRSTDACAGARTWQSAPILRRAKLSVVLGRFCNPGSLAYSQLLDK